MIVNCPGSKMFKQPQPENIKCPHCQADAEIWTDEVKVKCPNCGKIICRERGQSCLDWCKYAGQCMGLGTDLR